MTEQSLLKPIYSPASPELLPEVLARNFLAVNQLLGPLCLIGESNSGERNFNG